MLTDITVTICTSLPASFRMLFRFPVRPQFQDLPHSLFKRNSKTLQHCETWLHKISAFFHSLSSEHFVLLLWFAPCDISGVDTSSWVLPFQVQIHVADCHNSGLNTRCWVQQLKCAHIAEYYTLWGRHKLNANIHFFETLCWLLQFQVQTNHVDNSGLVTPQ